MKQPLLSFVSRPVLRRLAGVSSALLAVLGTGSVVFAQGNGQNPFTPPAAKLQYAPDRDYDLLHVKVTLDVDYDKRKFIGTTVNTLEPLRSLSQFRLMAGQSLEIAECTVDGGKATFKRDGNYLVVQPLARKSWVPGMKVNVSVRYAGGKVSGGGFGDEGGFHWIEPNKTEADHVGFWTQGETGYNSNWAPTWDYPNDFATSETITTVPAEWSVIGNGVKKSDKVENGRRTVHWEMKQPHATYLLAIYGGPLAIKEAKWQGVPLLYVVPKSKADLIDPSFSDTPDMLTFFSKVTGVKYPWPKYAQVAMYDFGGGMENVSATILGSGNLTDGRDGYRTMASLNSHELAHQWFGDLVTCKDWGEIWLNESFATYFDALYAEHHRGRDYYDQETENNMQAYFNEARRYKRPLSTKLYANPDSVFDSHAYPKGAAVLHTLRKMLGDEAFFKGINLYLTRHRFTPVETQDLQAAMTDASGINTQPFFDQWIYKPGHPVIEYTTAYDAAKGEVTLTVKQTQDTKDGTPIYTIPTKVAVISGGKTTYTDVTLNAAEQTVTVKADKPDAVLLDPEHNFLREMKANWQPSELLTIVRFAPNSIDRRQALTRLLASNPSDADIKAVAEILAADSGPFPALTNAGPLVVLKREDLRTFWRGQLQHKNYDRQAQAVRALGVLAPNADDTASIKGLLNDKAPYAVYSAAALALARLEPATGTTAVKQVLEGKANTNLKVTVLQGLASPELDTTLVRDLLRTALKQPQPFVAITAASVAAQRKDKELLPAVKELQANPPAGAPGWFKGALTDIIEEFDK